jgi:hypothetical protein
MFGFFDVFILLAESRRDIYIKGVAISVFGEIDSPKDRVFIKLSPNIREKLFGIRHSR